MGLLAGLALALLASLLLNGGYLLQHRGAADAPAVTPLHPLRTIAGLLRSRVWFAGTLLGLLGWAVHVGALARAPFSLVQAFSAGGLALAVPAGTWLLRERLTRRELAATALMVAALGALAVGASGSDPAAAVPTAGLTACLAVVAVAAGLLVLAASAAVAALGAAAGLLYGAADAATKAATLAARGHGLSAAFATPWPPLVVALSCGAFFCFQRGLQRGRAVPVIALTAVMTEVGSTVVGLLVFGDALGSTTLLATLHTLAFAAIAVAAWALAPGQARIAGGAGVNRSPANQLTV